MDAALPYPPGTRWLLTGRQFSNERITPLGLAWYIDGGAISDDYTPEEASASELWRLWTHGRSGAQKIHWTVDPIGDAAPFAPSPFPGGDALAHWSWPVHAETGEPVNWLRLPVLDKRWRPGRADKGGFIQEHTGWKPSPLQPAVDLALFRALEP